MGEHIIYGVIGFILGGVTGGYFAGTYLSREYRKRLAALEQQNDQLADENREAREKGLLEREKGIVEAQSNISSPIKVDNAIIASKIHKNEAFDKHFEDVVGPTDEDDFDPDDIYLIDADEFRRDIKTRDNETLTYYQEDGVLIDSAGNVIRNEADVIGFEAVGEVDGTEEDFLYVSNDIDDVMYEILVEHNQSYYRDILGLG